MNYTLAEKIVMPLTLCFIVLFGFVLKIILKNKSDKVKNIPLTMIIVIMLVLEVVKQTRQIVTKTWSYWSIPIHFCSSFLIWFSIAQFTKYKIKEVGQACSLASGILMTIAFYISPRNIIGDACSNPFASFSTFHTFIFHFLAVSYWIWLVMLNLYKPQKKHIWICAIIFSIYYVILIAMAYIFKTNYTNALYSVIPFVEAFRQNYGQVLYTLVMFLFGTISIVVILSLYRKIYLMINKTPKSKKIILKE